MSDFYDNKKNPNSNIPKWLQEKIDNYDPRRELTAEESKRLKMLETTAIIIKHTKYE